MGIVRVCAAAATAAAVVLYNLRSFPHRDRYLPSLLLLLFTWYAFCGGVVAVPVRSRPLAQKPSQKILNFHSAVSLCATAPTAICFRAAAAAATAIVIYSLRSFPQQRLPPLLLLLLLLTLLALLLFPWLLLSSFFHTCHFYL